VSALRKMSSDVCADNRLFASSDVKRSKRTHLLCVEWQALFRNRQLGVGKLKRTSFPNRENGCYMGRRSF